MSVDCRVAGVATKGDCATLNAMIGITEVFLMVFSSFYSLLFFQNKGCQLRQVICAWVKKSGFAKVVVLSSSHAYLRSDQQLHSMPLRYLVTPAMQTIVGNKFQKLKWKELEKINEAEQHIRIPGGGITKSLYNDSCSEGIPMAVLLIFCSEGDNIPDAFSLVNYLNEWLRLVGKTSTRSPKSSSQWKKPSSWKLMFGSGIPPAIF
uniref:Proteasome assembly chaperone 2 n=1 Tax=Latimeria chalumnae TaxID=7897 RepID=H3A6T7_LATCH|nr:PREDICTED: proteasome assembly chaperone 2 [Latimeria chalumnae]|eukprot:XP_005996562.1 PREDICTED: proteasome assembly chaperone 2 [Latimeria chalumnae]